ncbi:acyl-CoA dehydratase activase [Clostridiaceae bacterium M8S5]|nr:acyl-CoA dehydratase activase [Clostridiaceae bacterium M8S5]
MYSIGIDIGYATLKIVILNKKGDIVYQVCTFHHGNIKELLKKELEITKEKFNVSSCYIGFIGSYAKGFKNQLNDLSAVIEGTLYTNKDIQSIIEIGAQSSRYITNISSDNKSNIKYAMNSSCSAGTGSFLEEQVSRLGIKLDEYSDYTLKATQIPRIAGRCSVFSKTDMIHHQQDGAKVEDILMGLAYALARNYKSNVLQRMPLAKPIMFVGGVAKNEGVIKALVDILKLKEDDLVVEKESSNIGALGCALLAKDKNMVCDISEVVRQISVPRASEDNTSVLRPLIEFGKYNHENKHACKLVKGDINGYLGIDIGSTSTNLVLIDDMGDVVAYRYLRTKGNPRQAVKSGLESLYGEFNGKLNILGIGTTGSGRNLIGRELKADVIVNEITAQAKGAINIDEDVDTIFEIGGQDSKYIRIKNKRVVDFQMNKICAAGTGSFIEEQAKKLDINIEDYQSIALKGERPVNLGDRCTVFIEGNISKALANGKSKEDITAGLSYSIVNNYLNKVVAGKPIGENIFLQGGIAHNQSVVNAFKAVLNKDIKTPPFFSVTGAYGVALITKEDLEDKKKEDKEVKDICNVDDQINELFLKGYTGHIEQGKKTIGIPRVLFIHKLFPMFNEFFKSLGFNVILSEGTNKEIVALSQEYSLDETCYPIKLINGHVATLINKGVDYIFLPSLYTMKHPISKARKDYACVYMQTAPSIVEKTMNLKNRGIKLLSPALSFKFGKKYIMQTLLDLGKSLGKNKMQTSIALAKGMKRFKEFEKEVEKLGEEVIDSLRDEEKVFVIITRAYGIADEGLNMQIPRKLRQMGHKVLTLSNLPAHSYDLSDDYSNMYWAFGQHILSGAKIVKESKNLYAIYLTNHGCGPDTVLSHYFKQEMGNKPYLHIEVDEHDSNVGVMTRLEAFVESLKNSDYKDDEKRKVHQKKESEHIILPYLYPYSDLLKSFFENKGLEVSLLKQTDKESIEIGKKHTTSKEYLSMMSLIGDVFSQINKIHGRAKIWIPQTEGSETFGQYSRIIEQKLRLSGYDDIDVESPFIEDLLEEKRYGYSFVLLLIAGDLIMSSPKDYRDTLLDKIKSNIKSGTLNENTIITIAERIKQLLSKKKYDKHLYALGELSVVYNDILNNNQLSSLEKKNKIYYQPISETLYFRWCDFYKDKKQNNNIKQNLYRVEDIIKKISDTLGIYSPFDNDIDELIKVADELLPLYSGGNGRYRIAKQMRCTNNIDGVLAMSSMYENTSTIINLLKTEKEDIPILQLCFDGSLHSSNEEKIQNFIYYI